ETGVSDDVLSEGFDNLGAHIMGRGMFGGGPGTWDESWKGWWGENPPYHTPVFVLTHHARDPLVMQGGTTFFFLTDGIESALRQVGELAMDRRLSSRRGSAARGRSLSTGRTRASTSNGRKSTGSQPYARMDTRTSRPW